MYLLIIYTLLSSFIFNKIMQYELSQRELKRSPLPHAITYLFIMPLHLFTFKQLNGWETSFILISLIISCLVILSLIDYLCFELPNKLVLAIGIIAVFYQLTQPSFSPINIVIGFFAASLPLFLICLLSGGNMGGGDIKLAAACGIWLGGPMVLLGAFLSTLVASAWYLILMILRLKKLKSVIPFGPFLAIGFVMAHFYGCTIIEWYLQLVNSAY